MEVTCFNPSTGPLNVVWDPYKLIMSIQPIQFNYNVESNGGGAVFVNKNNDGLCNVNIKTRRKITNVSAPYLPHIPQLVKISEENFQILIHCGYFCAVHGKPGPGVRTSPIFVEFDRLANDLIPTSCKAEKIGVVEGCEFATHDSEFDFKGTFPNISPKFTGQITAQCKGDGN